MSGLLRREVLIPLLVILLGGGAYVTRPWADKPVPARRAAPAAAGKAAARAVTSRTSGSNWSPRPAARLRTSPRNPFRFLQTAAPPTAAAARRPVRPEFVAPPVPTGPPPPPPITLRFIGLIEAPPRTGRVALLSDGRGGLMYGREGDTVDGRYRMLRVGTDSIEMAYVDGRGRQTIRLSGQ